MLVDTGPTVDVAVLQLALGMARADESDALGRGDVVTATKAAESIRIIESSLIYLASRGKDD